MFQADRLKERLLSLTKIYSSSYDHSTSIYTFKIPAADRSEFYRLVSRRDPIALRKVIQKAGGKMVEDQQNVTFMFNDQGESSDQLKYSKEVLKEIQYDFEDGYLKASREIDSFLMQEYKGKTSSLQAIDAELKKLPIKLQRAILELQKLL